eukprot:gene14513-biopygen9610
MSCRKDAFFLAQTGQSGGTAAQLGGTAAPRHSGGTVAAQSGGTAAQLATRVPLAAQWRPSGGNRNFLPADCAGRRSAAPAADRAARPQKNGAAGADAVPHSAASPFES